MLEKLDFAPKNLHGRVKCSLKKMGGKTTDSEKFLIVCKTWINKIS